MLHRGRIEAQGTEEELATRFGSGGRVVLEVRGTREAVEKALAPVLEAHDGPYRDQGAGPVGAIYADAAPGVVRVELHPREDIREALAASVVGAGLGLLTLETKASGLERMFLSLSRAAAGGEA
jgi:ABC-type multidrug transport system ATPase subunit